MFGSPYAYSTQNIKSGHCKKKKASDNQVITLIFLTFDTSVF